MKFLAALLCMGAVFACADSRGSPPADSTSPSQGGSINSPQAESTSPPPADSMNSPEAAPDPSQQEDAMDARTPASADARQAVSSRQADPVRAGAIDSLRSDSLDARLEGAAEAQQPETIDTRPQSARTPPPPAPISLPDRFNVLLKRSIFAGDGVASAPVTVRHSETAGGAAPPPWVLRGVVVEDGECTAILEDPATHQVQRLKEGAHLGSGRIARLGLRGFEFVTGPAATQVAVGNDLQGNVVAPIVAPPPTAVAKGPMPGNVPAGPAAPPQGPTTMPAAVGAVMHLSGMRTARN